MDFKNLTPEQQEKARACKDPAELLKLAQDEGVELTDEQLEAVSGGSDWDDFCFDDEDCTFRNCGTFC